MVCIRKHAIFNSSSARNPHESMVWFKGKFTGKPHMNNGKIYDGFRLRFSRENQSIEISIVICITII